MKIGLIIILISIFWYIMHAVIYNYYLQKNNPEIFERTNSQRKKKQKNKEVQVVFSNGQIPVLVMLMGIPPIPLFFLGIAVTIIGFIMSLFK